MNYPLEQAKKEIISILKKTLSELKYKCEIKLETPPDENMGDFSFPCFHLASIAKKPPSSIAETISKKIKPTGWVEKTESKGPYVNFYLNKNKINESVMKTIFQKKEHYGHLDKKNKKVIIEHTSANPNGPLHVGRARNPIIGDTMVRVFKAAGYNVESQFYLDDMEKQVAILTWGVNNLDSKKIPKSERNKPDHKKVGYYQAASKIMEEDEQVSKQIGEIVKKSEE